MHGGVGSQSWGHHYSLPCRKSPLSLFLLTHQTDGESFFLEAHFSGAGQKTAAFSSSSGEARAQGFNSGSENHIGLEQGL